MHEDQEVYDTTASGIIGAIRPVKVHQEFGLVPRLVNVATGTRPPPLGPAMLTCWCCCYRCCAIAILLLTLPMLDADAVAANANANG